MIFMKFKKSIAVFLLLVLLFLIPLSFASDVDSSQMGSSNLNAINTQNDYLEDSVDDDCNLDSGSSSNLAENGYFDSGSSSNLVENGYFDSDSTLVESGDSSSNSNLNTNINENTYQSNPNYSEDGVRLADLDTSFINFNTELNDSNTIYVNSSYTGDIENGTQSNPFKSIQGGFNLLSQYNNAKSILFIANGNYNISNTIYIYTDGNNNINNFTIIGQSSQNTVINGNAKQILYISRSSSYSIVKTVNIFNLTFTNGLNHQGGAIHSSYTYLNLINTIFKNNSATGISSTNPGEGGAVYNDKGFLKIYNSSFINNSIYGNYEKYGGAIYNNLGELSIYNSKFINTSMNKSTNGSYGSGGAIYNLNGFLTLFNSSIINTTVNSSYGFGGAICNWNAKNTYIINSTISGNVLNGSYSFASAIAYKGVLLEVVNSTISDNYANGWSVENSTIYVINGYFNLINSNLVNNTIRRVNSSLIFCLEDQLIVPNIFGSDFTDDEWIDYDILNNLPSFYDLREENLVTPVQDQGGSGSCWAFATYAALESYLLKYENISYDFSENNMKNIMGYGTNSTNWADGGNYVVALAYLLRGSGPINESDDPYVASSHSSPENLTPVKYVSDVLYIPLRLGYLDNDQIKYAIMKYGALFTSICSNSARNNSSYYNPVPEMSNHAVAIVGWDDNYPKSNFRFDPPGDGAFIVKNSWGTYSGDGGYWYVSYYDPIIAGSMETISAMAITNVVNTSEYKNIYQYDILGNTFESLGYNCQTVWFANQFTAESDNPLNAFGLYTFGSSNYLLNITVNGISKLIQEGNITGAGYHTIKLNRLINLNEGDVFKVIVRLTTPGSLFPIAIESKRSDYSNKSTASLSQSFISADGVDWYDIAQTTTVVKFYERSYRINLQQTNVCLKAYTAYQEDLELNVSANTSFYKENSPIRFNFTVTNYNDPVQNLRVNIVLGENADLAYCQCSNGSFNISNNVWTIAYLGTGQSETLELNVLFNQFKENNTIMAYVNNLSYSLDNDLIRYLTVYRSSHTHFADIGYISAYAMTNETVNISLLNSSNDKIANENITVSLLASTNNYAMGNITLSTGSSGMAKLLLNLPNGIYTFSLSFGGNEKYDSSSAIFYFHVNKRKATKIIYSDMVTTTVVLEEEGGVGEYFNVTLKDSDNVPLANRLVQFGFNGKIYNKTTDSNGLAQLQINLKRSDIYTFAVAFLGDDDYDGAFVVAKITVNKKKMTLTVPNKNYKASAKTKTLTATLSDDKDRLIANKTITFTVNGKTYSAKTDSKGMAKVNVSLSTKKTYSFTVKFAGDNTYAAVTKTARLIIN